MEVLKNFRKEYGLFKEDYSDERFIKHLVEYDYNMSKAFQKLFE